MYCILRLDRRIVLPVICAVLLSAILFTGAALPKSSSDNGCSTSIGVIMYHGFIEEKGQQNQYMIDPSLLENDLEYLNSNGYHTMFIGELTDCIENNEPLPEKPIILTFDDGYYNNYRYAFPLLKKYNCKAVISPIGKATDDASDEKYRSPLYSQCRWNELKEMCDSGLVELQNHTYDMHSIQNGIQGASQKNGESDEEYEQRITEDLQKASQRIFEETGQKAETLTLPFGAGKDNTRDIAKRMGFKAVLDCEEKMNHINSSDDLFHIHRFLRPNKMSSAEFFEHKIDLQ